MKNIDYVLKNRDGTFSLQRIVICKVKENNGELYFLKINKSVDQGSTASDVN